MAVGEGDTRGFRLPEKLSSQILGILVLSVIPTGAVGGFTHWATSGSVAALSVKLDMLITKFDRLEGAGIERRIESLEQRERDLERAQAECRVLMEEMRREGKK